MRLAWRLEGDPVEARVPASLAGPAVALFPDLRRDPGADPPELALETLPGGGFRVKGGGPSRAASDAAGALAAFELTLAETLARRAGGVPVHAAGARLPRGAVALVGAGGGGKSTLAAALALEGCPLYGDDVLLLDDDGRTVRAFPRLVKLVGDAPRLLGLAPADGPLADLWLDADHRHPAALGSGWAEPARLAAILFLERDGAAGGVSLAPVGAAEAVRALLAQLQLVERADARAFAALAAAVDGAETAALRYGSAPAAARALVARWG